MVNEEYTVNIGNLKVSGSAEEIHKLAHTYGLAACEYGNRIVEEIHGEHRNNLIEELQGEQRKYENIEKHIIDAIRSSDYYREFSSKMSSLIDDVLEEVEAEKYKPEFIDKYDER